MNDFDRILAIKEAAEARLLALPGVHAVGVGKKIVNGKPTADFCITVFLILKKPLGQLSPGEVIPPEIDGIKTDVVEMEMPRLTMAANPSDLVATRSANQLSVTFSGEAGDGLVVVLYFTITPTGTPPGSPLYISTEIDSWYSMSDIAAAVAKALNDRGDTRLTALASGAQVTVTPHAGFAIALVHCEPIAVDDKPYFEDYVRGGIQIQSGWGKGTIGCLATTAPTALYPKGKVVALTCHHVVAPPSVQETNLTARVNGNRITFAVTGTQPLKFDTLVRVHLTRTKWNAFYNTVAGDTVKGVALSIAAAISELPGMSATAAEDTVTVSGDTPDDCKTQGPPKVDLEIFLTATVVGTTIHFAGGVSGDDYEVFLNVNTGGTLATFGVYVNPANGATPIDVARAVAKAVNALPTLVRFGVTAEAIDVRVVVSLAQEVECVIRTDRQAGQPDDSIGLPCSPCCNHRIGLLLDARIDIDTAIIQLDARRKYKPMIEELGLVRGSASLNLSDLHILHVLKRGRTTGKTEGLVWNLGVSGEIGGAGVGFIRHYTNVAVITTLMANNKPFALPGDSGSAVYNGGGEVVGLLFGHGSLIGLNTAIGFITPIEQITAAFSELNLNFAPAPEAGKSPEDVRIIPAAAMVDAAALNIPALGPAPFIGKLLAQAEEEITATPAGFEYAQLMKRHFAETQRLVNSNRRVATVWQRNGGPQILQAVLRVLQLRDKPLPEEINGRPLIDCLEQIKRVLARYASPSLAADLSWFTPRLARFSGLTYTQMLSALQTGSE